MPESIARWRRWLEEVGDLALKGLMQAVAVYNVVGELQASYKMDI
jgi:hypothetical protein